MQTNWPMRPVVLLGVLVLVATCLLVLWKWNDTSDVASAVTDVKGGADNRVAKPASGVLDQAPAAADLSPSELGVSSTHKEVTHSRDLHRPAAIQSTSRGSAVAETKPATLVNGELSSKTQTTIELSANTVANYQDKVWRDCHGAGISDCRRLIETFTRVMRAPEFVDDGWSDWMEGEIRASLAAQASKYKSTGTTAKCDADGCVFALYADTAQSIFDNGWRNSNDFDKWLRKQSWNEWLEVHSLKNGNRSTLEWRLSGSLSVSPFINWYIVTRKQ